MFRQSPSRSQRSKGIRVKNVLQICLLLAVCFWLIYQVKHSHDKKKEFDANDTKISLDTQSDDELIKFGRKDLHPKLEEISEKIVKHDEEEAEDETGGEEEAHKHEEEEEEEDKTEEKDEGRAGGGGDDEIDENEQEKPDGEVDRGEESIDEEEGEEGDEKESEENDGQTENDSTLEDHNQEGSARNTHEAREEHYKADDASSAVTHDTQTIGTDVENENSNENTQVENLEYENVADNTEDINVSQNTTEVKVEDGKTSENGTSLHATVEEMGSEIDLSNSSLNNTITIESNYHLERSNNSTEVSETLSLQNGTEITSDSTQVQNSTEWETTSGEGSNLQTIFPEQASNPSIVSGNNKSDSNSMISIATENTEETPGWFSNYSTNPKFVVSEKIIMSNESLPEGDRSRSSEAEVSTDESQKENLDTGNGTDGTDEISGSSETVNADEVEHDPIDTSDSSNRLEEKEVRTDLDTLPEIRTEGSNSEDAAAE